MAAVAAHIVRPRTALRNSQFAPLNRRSEIRGGADARHLYAFQGRLKASGYGAITTEIVPAPDFYYAEDYHQQYLAKNPDGYCGLGGTGVTCPVGVGANA